MAGLGAIRSLRTFYSVGRSERGIILVVSFRVSFLSIADASDKPRTLKMYVSAIDSSHRFITLWLKPLH